MTYLAEVRQAVGAVAAMILHLRWSTRVRFGISDANVARRYLGDRSSERRLYDESMGLDFEPPEGA